MRIRRPARASRHHDAALKKRAAGVSITGPEIEEGPAIARAATPATYDRFAARYDEWMRPLEKRLLSRLRAKTLGALPDGARLLEVGAGTGLNFPFYPPGARGAATEPSGEMLKVARDKERPPAVHLVQNPAESLPFQDASFDVALATLVFCSVECPARGFAELRRVVRPGGSILLLEHVRPEGLLGPLFDALSLLTVALFNDHFNRRTSREAERAGLRLVKRERYLLGIINIIELKNDREAPAVAMKPTSWQRPPVESSHPRPQS